jgi:hypothetical protein
MQAPKSDKPEDVSAILMVKHFPPFRIRQPLEIRLSTRTPEYTKWNMIGDKLQ